MMRSSAEDVALSTIHFCSDQLARSQRFSEVNRCALAYLRAARDRLHEACSVLEHTDACETHEEIYLPLFDALAYVTDSMRASCFNRTMVAAAAQTLIALRDHIHRSRA